VSYARDRLKPIRLTKLARSNKIERFILA